MTISKRLASPTEPTHGRVTVADASEYDAKVFYKFDIVDRTRERYRRQKRHANDRPEVVTDGGLIAGLVLEYRHAVRWFDGEKTDAPNLDVPEYVVDELHEHGATEVHQ